MADPITDFNTAADGFAAVLAKVADTSLDTPCEGWKIQNLLDHVVGGSGYYANEWGGIPASDDPDHSARYAANRAAFVEVISRPGVLDEMIPSPIGEGQLPRAVMVGIFTSDTLIHTWDLAQALGDDVRLDPDLLERSWQNAIPMDEVLRGPGIFGPKVDVEDDASPQVKALAFFGRDAR